MDNNNLASVTVILIRGLPGSGKSYLATELTKSLGNNVVMLDPDATDYDSQDYADHVAHLQAAGVEPKLYAYRFLRAQAYQAIKQRKLIIWNQPFTDLEIFQKMVTKLQNCAAEHRTSINILVVEVEIGQALAKARIAKRKRQGGHGPSDKTFVRFTNEYRSAAKLGYRTITVPGNGDAASAVRQIIDQLKLL